MGIVGTHPGSLRKSGTQRTYGIRNLEECTEDGREDRGRRAGSEQRKVFGLEDGPPVFCKCCI